MRKRNTFFFFSVKSPFLPPKRMKNAEKILNFTILGYAKTTKNSRKNVQKQAKKANKKYHFFQTLNAFCSKSNLCAYQKTSASGNGKTQNCQTRPTRHRPKAAIANTTLNKGNEHRTQNHCGTKDKARASRFLHSVEKYESRNEHHEHDERNDRDYVCRYG